MIVLDASIVIKLLIEEEDSPKARALVKANEKITVPDILFVEVAGTLATKTNYLPEKIAEGLDFLYRLDLAVYPMDQKLVTQAAIDAKRLGTAVYDMLYAILSKRLRVKLVTADEKFARKTGFSWVRVL